MSALRPFRSILLLLTLAALAAVPTRAARADTLETLIQQLRFASNDGDRERAADRLGQLGDPAALPALRESAIYDREDDVREAARSAVQRIERSAGAAYSALPALPSLPSLPSLPGPAALPAADRVGPLIDQLRFSPGDAAREAAARELGLLAEPRAVPALRWAKEKDRDRNVRRAADSAIDRIADRFGDWRRALERIDRLIGQLLFSNDDDDREDAAKDLGKLGDARALAVLDDEAQLDPDGDVRDEARKSADRIRGLNPYLDTPGRVFYGEPAPTCCPPPAPAPISRCAVHGRDLPCPLCAPPPPPRICDNYTYYGPVPNYDYDRSSRIESYVGLGLSVLNSVLNRPTVIERRPTVIYTRPQVVVRRPVTIRTSPTVVGQPRITSHGQGDRRGPSADRRDDGRRDGDRDRRSDRDGGRDRRR